MKYDRKNELEEIDRSTYAFAHDCRTELRQRSF